MRFIKRIHHLVLYAFLKIDGYFDSAYYLKSNPDVRKTGINPLMHFIMYGWKEGRSPSAHYSNSIGKINDDDNISFWQVYHFYKSTKEKQQFTSKRFPNPSDNKLDYAYEDGRGSNFLDNIQLEELRFSKGISIKSKQKIISYCENQNVKLVKFIGTRARYDVIGITRVRNEELIFEDTIEHMSKLVDKIIVFDDHSLDKTLNIAVNSPLVITVLKNKEWKVDRISEETRHRQILLNFAKLFNPKWIFYFDADERFEGNFKDELLDSNEFAGIDGIRINLFDAYITRDDKEPVVRREKLFNRRNLFGIECREILMLWRNLPGIHFEGLDSREPVGCNKIITRYYCQHYGKAISIEQWDATCNYYSNYFPEPYKSKWASRMGKAIHTKSDFGTGLASWEEAKEMKICISK